MLRSTIEALALVLFVGVPVPLWDAFWLATGYPVSIYGAQFRTVFRLEIASIDLDGVPTDVVRPTPAGADDYVLYALFLLTPTAACLDHCQQSKVLPP